jgi:hypothetical protein
MQLRSGRIVGIPTTLPEATQIIKEYPAEYSSEVYNLRIKIREARRQHSKLDDYIMCLMRIMEESWMDMRVIVAMEIYTAIKDEFETIKSWNNNKFIRTTLAKGTEFISTLENYKTEYELSRAHASNVRRAKTAILKYMELANRYLEESVNIKENVKVI